MMLTACKHNVLLINLRKVVLILFEIVLEFLAQCFSTFDGSWPPLSETFYTHCPCFTSNKCTFVSTYLSRGLPVAAKGGGYRPQLRNTVLAGWEPAMAL